MRSITHSDKWQGCNSLTVYNTDAQTSITSYLYEFMLSCIRTESRTNIQRNYHILKISRLSAFCSYIIIHKISLQLPAYHYTRLYKVSNFCFINHHCSMMHSLKCTFLTNLSPLTADMNCFLELLDWLMDSQAFCFGSKLIYLF